MRVLHLYGDSIFDNVSYVEDKCAVTNHMVNSLPKDVKHILEAVDGHKVRDTMQVLSGREGLYKFRNDVGAVLSVGGNDALEVAHILLKPVTSVNEALNDLSVIVDNFTRIYQELVLKLLDVYYGDNVRLCTIYDKIPVHQIGLERSAMVALALFNNVITETASLYNLKLIDLRVVCNTPDCYSSVSPIEPSNKGGKRIAEAIVKSYEL